MKTFLLIISLSVFATETSPCPDTTVEVVEKFKKACPKEQIFTLTAEGLNACLDLIIDNSELESNCTYEGALLSTTKKRYQDLIEESLKDIRAVKRLKKCETGVFMGIAAGLERAKCPAEKENCLEMIQIVEGATNLNCVIPTDELLITDPKASQFRPIGLNFFLWSLKHAL